jgi:hypothetical protein
MSNPSFSNIDRWLFELMEGNLSEEQVAQLESFLIQHPELDVDRDMWELSKVDTEQVVYPHTDKLIRRRPVGIFMSLGVASIVGVIAIGMLMHWPNSVGSDDFILQSSNLSSGSLSSTGLSLEKKISAKSDSYGDEQLKDSGLAESMQSGEEPHEQYASGLLQDEVVYDEVSTKLVDAGYIQVDETKLTAKEDETASIETKEKTSGVDSVSLAESKKHQEIQVSTAEQVSIETSTFSQLKNGKVTGLAKSNNTHSSYKKSFSLKIRQISRTVSRMLDNPVALKNLKDPHYHVPGLQSTEVNFGAVGTLLTTRVQTQSRMQWYGESNQQLMNSLSIDGYSYGMRGGLGIQVNHSLYADGGIQSIYSAITYSPKFSVSRNVILEPSIRFTMGNKTIDPTKIQSGSMVETERFNSRQFYTVGQTPIGRSLWYRDLGLGLSVNTRWFYASVQGDNLLRHTDNIYSGSLTDIRRSGQHFIATIGTDYESRKENLGVSPYLVYQQYENLKEAWLGMNFRYRWFTVGGALSSQLDPAVSIGLKFTRFMLAYNADYTQSQVLGKQSLSHQITLRFLTKTSRMGQRILNL